MSPPPKPRGKPHTSHVASITQRIEASRDGTRDTEGEVKGRRPQPPPSGGDRGREKLIHPNPPTAESTAASRPALKPKPVSLRSRQDSDTNSGTSRRHAENHGSLPRKDRSEVPSNRSRGDSTRGRQGDGDPSPSLKRPVVKPSVPKHTAIGQQQHHHPTPATGGSTDLLGNLPQLPVFVSDEEKTHSRESGRRMDTHSKPSQPLKHASPDLARTSDPAIRKLLIELQQQAADSDYYRLLGVEPGASEKEVVRARREKSRQLHPDHYGNDPERREK